MLAWLHLSHARDAWIQRLAEIFAKMLRHDFYEK